MRTVSDAIAFSFDFDDRMRPWARLFRVTPTNSSVTVGETDLDVRFGPWRLVTPWFNIVGASIDGPYRRWKVAGPARLSLADRGITFATTPRRGVCLVFRDPVSALDPFRIVRHPCATVTVADPERFVELVRQRVSGASRTLVDDPTPRRHTGTLRRTIGAIVGWSRRDTSVASRTRDVDELFVPSAADDEIADGQPISDGKGAWFHRRYLVAVAKPALDGLGAMAAIKENPNVLIDEKLAPFTKLRGTVEDMTPGDRYVVETAGPWSGPVEVIELTARSFRLATLDGHMEAGMIEFAVAEDDDGGELQFTIESWSRSAGHAVDALYDRLSLAKDVQSEMWVGACERFVELVEGTQLGPVDVETERSEHGPNAEKASA